MDFFPHRIGALEWLVVGGSGILGSNFALRARNHGPVHITYHCHPVSFSGCASLQLDIRDEREIQKVMQQVRPKWVLHAAAMTDVDACERNPQHTREINAVAAASVAAAARDVGASFVYVSTDAVFDGSRGDYSEDDLPSPVNCYGASKLLGEEMVRKVHPAALVVRTNLYGWSRRTKLSYSEWLLEKMKQAIPFHVFQNVRFNPLLTNTLSDVILRLAQRQCQGIVHLGNASPCSKLEFARILAKTFGVEAEKLIRPMDVEEVGLYARRPHDTTLNCARAEKWLGQGMPSLQEELSYLRRLIDTGVVHELLNEVAVKTASTESAR